jgi:hypothetical protein
VGSAVPIEWGIRSSQLTWHSGKEDLLPPAIVANVRKTGIPGFRIDIGVTMRISGKLRSEKMLVTLTG